MYEHGVVSDARPEAWGERSVLACTLTILRTCGLRDPNALSQPLVEIKNAPHYESLLWALLYIVLYLVAGESPSHNRYCGVHVLHSSRNLCDFNCLSTCAFVTGACAFARQAARSTPLCRVRCTGETKTSASPHRSLMRSTSAWSRSLPSGTVTWARQHPALGSSPAFSA
jgi:hypothetical protein